MTEKHILIIEDEPKIAQILVDFLTLEGFACSVLHQGNNAVETIQSCSPTPAAIILDLMLPGKDGLTICKEVRQFSQVPILMLTARIDEIDRLIGLEIGADDYICKPFSAREVVARIKAVLRRTSPARQKETDSLTYSYQSLQINLEKFSCQIGQIALELTPVEFRILTHLIKKPGVVFNREQLMTVCYEDDRIVSGRTIDSHMKNLRNKLNKVTQQSPSIHSVYGIGYKLE